jgi:hypothetical protein
MGLNEVFWKSSHEQKNYTLTGVLYVVRVRTLQTLKQHQLRELEHMEQEKLKLKQTAEQLAEKYEDTKDKQEEITKRQDMGCIIQSTNNFVGMSETSHDSGKHLQYLCLV